ncbi:hypothetical protein [Natrarchaeobaculum aegyptiacum]|uniref:hypothetical protein n=1 Tax=Natrarchaeobaculum aegyptiacum TaxID=745377 RepID=UPI0012601C66|nr:hypothetical protein [Natrarchaeobaculum aegyptiacum]
MGGDTEPVSGRSTEQNRDQPPVDDRRDRDSDSNSSPDRGFTGIDSRRGDDQPRRRPRRWLLRSTGLALAGVTGIASGAVSGRTDDRPARVPSDRLENPQPQLDPEEIPWGPVLESGQTVEGEIESLLDRSMYSFDAEAGDEVRIEFARPGGSGEFYVGVFGPGAQLLAWETVEPDESTEFSGEIVDSGIHNVTVRTYYADAAGPYELAYVNEDRPPAEDPDEPVDPDDPEPDPEPEPDDIEPIEPGETRDGELDGFEDAALYSVLTGDPITVEVTRDGGSGTFGVGILDASFDVRAYAEGGPDETITVSTTPFEESDFTLGVIGADDDAAGAFTLEYFDEERDE